jgi:hypothetical protein
LREKCRWTENTSVAANIAASATKTMAPHDRDRNAVSAWNANVARAEAATTMPITRHQTARVLVRRTLSPGAVVRCSIDPASRRRR